MILLDIEKNFNSSSEIKDIFREIQYCKNEKCPLEMKNSDVNVLVLYSVLQRYRTFFRIDGIRWIVNECNQYVGGDCSSTNQESIQYDYDFWNLIKELGFTIVLFFLYYLLCRSQVNHLVFLPMIII